MPAGECLGAESLWQGRSMLSGLSEKLQTWPGREVWGILLAPQTTSWGGRKAGPLQSHLLALWGSLLSPWG